MKAVTRAQWFGAAAAVAFAAVVAWVVLQPPKSADLADVDPAALAAVMHTGFGPARSIRRLKYEVTVSDESATRELVRKTEILPPSGGVSERRSRTYQRENQVHTLDQSVSLIVGPIDLVTYSRYNVPFVSALLPYHFWITRRLIRFESKANSGFPAREGSSLEAGIVYRTYFADGTVEDEATGTLACRAETLRRAAELNAAFAGEAMRMTCVENLPWRESPYQRQSVGWYLLDHDLWIADQRRDTFGEPERGFALSVSHSFRLVSVEPAAE